MEFVFGDEKNTMSELKAYKVNNLYGVKAFGQLSHTRYINKLLDKSVIKKVHESRKIETTFNTSTLGNEIASIIYCPYNSIIEFLDGTLLEIWTANRWYAFACSGRIFSSENELLYSWYRKPSVDRNTAYRLACIWKYSSTFQIRTIFDDYKDIKCSCGGDLYKAEVSSKQFLLCKRNKKHYTRVDSIPGIEMDPYGISYVNMEK